MASRISDLKLGVVKISLESFCRPNEKTRKFGQYWGIGSRKKLGPDPIRFGAFWKYNFVRASSPKTLFYSLDPVF